MILASGSAASEIISAASLTSNSPSEGPPVMFRSTPLAPFIVVYKSGLCIACLAAS